MVLCFLSGIVVMMCVVDVVSVVCVSGCGLVAS